MVVKGFLLAGLGVFLFLGLAATPRVLERGVKAYLRKSFPGSQADVHVSAPLFWFVSGNLRRISVRLSHFDASQFPLPVAGAAAEQVTDHPVGNHPVPDHPVAGAVVTPAAPPAIAPTESPADSGTPAAEQVADVVTDEALTQTAASEVDAGVNDGRPPESRAPGGHAARIYWAKIGHIVLDLNDFTFKDQHIERLHASIPDVRYDYGLARRKHLLELGGSGRGNLQITLSERDINGAVTLDRSDIRALHVIPEAGNLRVTLDYRTLLGWVPVAVTGELAVQGGHAIWFVNPSLSVVRVPLPQAATDLILGRVQNLNPVFDLDRLDLPMDVRLTAVSSTPATVTVTGLIQIPGPGAGPGLSSGLPAEPSAAPPSDPPSNPPSDPPSHPPAGLPSGLSSGASPGTNP